MRMFQRFTDSAMQVVARAQQNARVLQHSHVGPEHILWALIQVEKDNGPDISASVLIRLGLSEATIREAVVRLTDIGKRPNALAESDMPYSPRAKKAFELALRETLCLGHNYIEPEHILLGIAREEEEGGTSTFLDSIRGSPEFIRIGMVEPLSIKKSPSHWNMLIVDLGKK